MSQTAGRQKKKINLKWFESFKTSNLDATDIPPPTKPLSLVLPKQLPTGDQVSRVYGDQSQSRHHTPSDALTPKEPRQRGC